MRTLVIIPTFNERANIMPLVDALMAVHETLDLLIVDDASPDGTGMLADEIARDNPHVTVLHRATKQGLGTAYIAGFRHALAHGYERIVEMDSDFSHRPEDLPRLLAATETADIAVGSRNIPGGRIENWPPLRRAVSKGGSLFARLVLGLPMRDCTSGFKCFRREVLATLDIDRVRSNGYGFQIEVNNLCHRAGFRIAEVPIIFPDRQRGASKMSATIVAEAAMVVLRLGGERLLSSRRWPATRPARAALAHGIPTRPVNSAALRILMVASEAPPIHSGIARVVQVLRDGLQARGHTVDVVAYPQIPRVTFGEVRLSGLIFKFGALARRFDDYDIIHLHGAAPTFSEVFLLLARLLRARPPLVYTHHCDIDLPGLGFLDNLYNRLHRRLSAVADGSVGTALDYLAEQYPSDDPSAIPLGVDANRFGDPPTKDDQFTVLFVGQFRPYKGVRVLLDAMARVHGARLIVAGKGGEEAAYRERARQLGLDVEFHIAPDDATVLRLYQRAHAIVLPSVSRAEAFGIVLLEGMSAGCVPVASNLPGVREVVGHTGFTFPPKSAPQLAAVLRHLRDHPHLATQLGARARDRAAEYTWERCVTQYERLFHGLAAVRAVQAALVDSPQDTVPALRSLLAQVTSDWRADSVAVVRWPEGSAPNSIGLHTDGTAIGTTALTTVEALVAHYSHRSGEQVISRPGSAPQPLAAQLDGEEDSLITAPLIAAGQTGGVILVRRTHPFTDYDLDDLVRLARHASSAIIAAHEHFCVETGPPALQVDAPIDTFDRAEESQPQPASLSAAMVSRVHGPTKIAAR